MEDINYLLIAASAFAAIASPGPATLAIAATSMNQGRLMGLSLALGVLTGSFFWSTSAAFGLATILNNNIWFFEILRYCGAFYLLYLAYKSLRSAFNPIQIDLPKAKATSVKGNYFKGLLIHLTNPKAILFFGALYSVGVPTNSQPIELLSVIIMVGTVSSFIFLGYAILFSKKIAREKYLRSKVVFESAFALIFGIASLKLLTTKIAE